MKCSQLFVPMYTLLFVSHPILLIPRILAQKRMYVSTFVCLFVCPSDDNLGMMADIGVVELLLQALEKHYQVILTALGIQEVTSLTEVIQLV